MKRLALILIAAGFISIPPVTTTPNIGIVPNIMLNNENPQDESKFDDAVSLISKETEISEQDKKELLEKVVYYTTSADDSKRQVLLASRKTYHSIEEILVKFLNDNPKKELMGLLEAGLDDLQNQQKVEKTNFSYTVPKNKKELVVGNFENRQIAIVADIFYTRKKSVNFHDIGKEFEDFFSQNAPYYSPYSYSLKTTKNSYSLDRILLGTSIIALLENFPGVLMSMATNFYAHQLTKSTIDHIVKDLNSMSNIKGKPLTENEINAIDESWRQQHLMASYALASLWLNEFGRKNLGLKKEDMTFIHLYSKEFDKVRTAAYKIGLKKFLEYYISNPQLIFNNGKYK